MEVVIAITRNDGAVSIMRIPDATFQPPRQLVTELEAARTNLAGLQESAATATGDALVVANALVSIAEVDVRTREQRVTDATPDYTETITRELNRWQAANEHRWQMVGWRFVDASEERADRTFRDAWTDSVGLGVNMVVAREIHRNNLREQRKKRLADLDVELFRAIEIKDPIARDEEVSRIAGVKQVLRDATQHPSIENASNTDELVAVTLDSILAESIP